MNHSHILPSIGLYSPRKIKITKQLMYGVNARLREQQGAFLILVMRKFPTKPHFFSLN